MSDSSSSSSSDSENSPLDVAPVPALKRKRKPEKPVAEDSDSEQSDSGEQLPEIPALSHAERRRQKKKEKQAAKDTETEAEEEEGEASAPKSKKRKVEIVTNGAGQRQNSVWVGNMSFKTTPEDLKEFFDAVGEVTRIHMPLKPSSGPGFKPENRGFAYVDFSTADAKLAAIACSERPLIGRKLLIKDGDDFAGRPALPVVDDAAPKVTHSKTAQKILRAQKQPPAPTLFFGNLGFEATEKSIRELLTAHRAPPKKNKKAQKEGEDASDDESEDEQRDKTKPKVQDIWIRRVRMGTFEDSGLCKGFAFVDFTTIEHATAVLINPKNHLLDGRKLVVEYASADAVRRGAVKPKREDGSGPGARERPSTFRGNGKGNSRKPQRPSRFAEDLAAEASVDYSDVNAASRDDFAGVPVALSAETFATAGARHQKGPRVRPKPGAALALAKRESAAILPSKGQKITF